jgi:rfaE bifunctional protein kinase chain/domain
MLTTELIESILTSLPQKRIALVGDLFLDRYLQIAPELDEPSIETGLTAYQVTGVRSYPGALGTVLNNLVALGVGEIIPISILGDDGEGYELQQALLRLPGVDMSRLLMDATRRTPTYTKPMYGREELNRLDIKNRTPTPEHLQDAIVAAIYEVARSVDAIIVLDQVSEVDCGVITCRVRDAISGLAQAYPGLFILADSREQIGEFRHVAVKPNERECWQAVYRVPPKVYDFRLEFLDLQRQVGGPVFLTQGEKGMTLCDGNGPVTAIASYPVTGPVDICGAGDSCSAGLVAAKVCGASLIEAGMFGNLVASITVQQIGTTGTARPEQVRARWEEVRRRQ